MWINLEQLRNDQLYQYAFKKALLAGKKIFFKFSDDNEKRVFCDGIGEGCAIIGAASGIAIGANIGAGMGLPGILIGSLLGCAVGSFLGYSIGAWFAKFVLNILKDRKFKLKELWDWFGFRKNRMVIQAT